MFFPFQLIFTIVLALSENLLSTSSTVNSSSDHFLRNLSYNVLVSPSLFEFLLVTIIIIKSLYLSVLFHELVYLYIQGTTSKTDYTNYRDPGIYSDLPIFNIQPQCTPATTLSFSFRQPPLEFHKGIHVTKLCVKP